MQVSKIKVHIVKKGPIQDVLKMKTHERMKLHKVGNVHISKPSEKTHNSNLGMLIFITLKAIILPSEHLHYTLMSPPILT